MTTTPTEKLLTISSDDPVAVPVGRMACQGCGVAVPPPASLSQVVYADVVKAYSPTGTPHGGTRVSLGQCRACADRAHAAVALAAAHPALTAALGQHRAVEAAEGILTALAVLGVDAPPTDLPDKRLGVLVRNIASVGLGVRWRKHIAASNLIDFANPHPWAHVRSTDRARLGEAYAAALAERVSVSAGPVRVAPPALTLEQVSPGQQPIEGGCGICGVGHVTVPADRVARSRRDRLAASVWTLHSGVAPDTLGGHRSPARLAIWLCPACEDAFGWEHSMGPSTMERALLASLDRLGSLAPDMEVPGLIGWARIVADTLRRGLPAPRPNAVPFDHLDLSALSGPVPIA